MKKSKESEVKYVFPFNPQRDISRVEQFGFVDLAQANSMNSLPANLSAEQLSYNEIDDPKSIGYRPRDQFEHAQGAKVIASYAPPEKSAE